MRTKLDDQGDETRQIAIRLPVTLLERVAAHAKRIKKKTPGLSVTRADAIRVLLLDALEGAEKEEKEVTP